MNILTTTLALALAVQGAPAPPPSLFAAGVISTDAEEYRITFTPDGATAFFARSDEFFPAARRSTIFMTTFAGGKWSPPRVAPFSGAHADLDPFVSPDGTKVYFSSIRPVDGAARSDADLWVVERTASGFGEPRNLGEVNSPSDELYPSLDRDGTLYFGSDRTGGTGGWDVYRAVPKAGGGFEAPVGVETVNTELWEFNPVVSPDGRMLFFTALNQPRGRGLGDLYVSFRYEKTWLPPQNLGDMVNTRDDEYHPSLAPNGKYLFFVRRTQARKGDLYVVSLDAVSRGIQVLQEERPRLGPKKDDRVMPPGRPGPGEGRPPREWPGPGPRPRPLDRTSQPTDGVEGGNTTSPKISK